MIFLRILGVVVTLPLLFFVPGYALFRSRLFKDEGLPWVEKLLLVCSLSVSTASLVALALAEAGYLRIWLLDIILVAFSLIVWFFPGRMKRPLVSPGRTRLEVVMVAVLVVVSVVLFFRPAEFVAGEGDPEFYFNIGYHVADTGSMNVHDPSIVKMSDDEIKTFYYKRIGQFFPFQLRDRATGRVQPLLYHLLPTWIGMFIMLFGKFGGLYVVPVFSLLGVLALYVLARRFSSPLAAGAGALLAAVFFLQAWFSRAPVSEVFCQFFILCSILFFFDFLKRKDLLLGLGAALAITAASTARPEAVVVVVPMLIIMIVEMFRERYRAGDYVFVNALLLGLVYILLYVRFCEFEYVSGNFGKVIRMFGDKATLGTVLEAAAVLVAVAFVFYNLPLLHGLLRRLWGRLSERLSGGFAPVEKFTRLSFSLLVLAAFVYLYPAVTGPNMQINSPQKIFLNTSLYFGGPTVFVFVLGLALLVFKVSTAGFSFLISVSVVALATVLQRSSLALGQYPWDSRRLMLLAVPMFFAGFAYLFHRLWETERLELRVLPAMATACFLALSCYFIAPVFNHVDYRGVDGQLTELAKKLDDDVVIFSDWYTGEVFGMPLRYQHGVDARKIYSLKEAGRFAGIVKRYTDEGKKVLVEMTGVEKKDIEYNTDIEKLLSFSKAFDFKLSFPRLYPAFEGRPVDFITQRHDLQFFYVTPKQ